MIKKPKNILHSVKGMKDLFDDSLLKQNLILQASRQILQKHGFSPILLNILEHEEVFKRSLGEDSEIVSKEMYTLKDLNNNTLVMRPEGTAGLLRMVLETNLRYSLPKKLYYEGPMFRYERPQKGRFRQFYQIGVESLGSMDFFADVEVIAIAYDILKTLRPRDSFQVEINTLGTTEERKEYNKALTSYFNIQHNYEKLSELSKVRLQKKNPLRILDSKEKSDIEISEKSPKIHEFLGIQSQKNYNNIKEALKLLEIPIFENSRLVRGLDYYNDVCFEIKIQDPLSLEKSQSTLIGGGRYNLLGNILLSGGNNCEQIGVEPIVPATGFAAGIERISDLLDSEDIAKYKEKTKKIKIGLVPIITKECPETKKIQIKAKLFNLTQKFDESCSFELLTGDKKPDKYFEYLEKRAFDFAFIIGENEFEKNEIKVKDLAKRESMVFSASEFGGKLFEFHCLLKNQKF